MVVIQMFEWAKQKQQERNLYVNGNTQTKRQSMSQINEDVDFDAMQGRRTYLVGHRTTVRGRRRMVLPPEKLRRMVLWYRYLRPAWRRV